MGQINQRSPSYHTCNNQSYVHVFSVDKKEKKAGNNPEQELKDSGFQDVSRVYVTLFCCCHIALLLSPCVVV